MYKKTAARDRVLGEMSIGGERYGEATGKELWTGGHRGGSQEKSHWATEGVSAAPWPSAADPRATWSVAGGSLGLPDVYSPGAQLGRSELEVVDGSRLQILCAIFANRVMSPRWHFFIAGQAARMTEIRDDDGAVVGRGRLGRQGLAAPAATNGGSTQQTLLSRPCRVRGLNAVNGTKNIIYTAKLPRIHEESVENDYLWRIFDI
ncbi:hypothetical protein B0H14DRAFT_2605238 [Mycena olivaceomarginata]|nr:hypothetical protein B0H14DRAFT_2605238 [Mycena olivaceomarginata]